jgi:ABC transporter substrate binding protein
MRAKFITFALSTMLFAICSLAEAQQPTKKIPRVGFLSLNSASVQKERVEVFREALQKLGYVEGQNIIIDYRFADGKSERLPALAAELVALKVDVIVTAGNSATAPAKDATKTIPIVMMIFVRLVTSKAKPSRSSIATPTISWIGSPRLLRNSFGSMLTCSSHRRPSKSALPCTPPRRSPSFSITCLIQSARV